MRNLSLTGLKDEVAVRNYNILKNPFFKADDGVLRHWLAEGSSNYGIQGLTQVGSEILLPASNVLVQDLDQYFNTGTDIIPLPPFTLAVFYKAQFAATTSNLEIEVLDVLGIVVAVRQFSLASAEYVLDSASVLLSSISIKGFKLRIKAPAETGILLKAVMFVPGEVDPKYLIGNFITEDSAIDLIDGYSNAKVAGFRGSYIPATSWSVTDTPVYVQSGHLLNYDVDNDGSYKIHRAGVYEILLEVNDINSGSVGSSDFKLQYLSVGQIWGGIDGGATLDYCTDAGNNEASSSAIAVKFLEVGDKVRIIKNGPSFGKARGSFKYLGSKSTFGGYTETFIIESPAYLQLPWDDTTTGTVSVTVSPNTVTIGANGVQNFSAVVNNSLNQAVTWSIVEGSTGGTITSSGIYTAPDASSGTFTIRATSLADNTKSGDATVSVVAGIVVSLSPSNVSVTFGSTQQFVANVSGTVNTAVTWKVVEGALGGTVTPSGLYTPPSTAGNYHVRATSVADTSRYGTSTISVGQNVSVSLAPNTVLLPRGGTQTFIATVQAASNPNVTWAILEGDGGTVTNSGVYTAPTHYGSFHVVATSIADITKSGAALVGVGASATWISNVSSIDTAISAYTGVYSHMGIYPNNGTTVTLGVAGPSVPYPYQGSYRMPVVAGKGFVALLYKETPQVLDNGTIDFVATSVASCTNWGVDPVTVERISSNTNYTYKRLVQGLDGSLLAQWKTGSSGVVSTFGFLKYTGGDFNNWTDSGNLKTQFTYLEVLGQGPGSIWYGCGPDLTGTSKVLFTSSDGLNWARTNSVLDSSLGTGIILFGSSNGQAMIFGRSASPGSVVQIMAGNGMGSFGGIVHLIYSNNPGVVIQGGTPPFVPTVAPVWTGNNWYITDGIHCAVSSDGLVWAAPAGTNGLLNFVGTGDHTSILSIIWDGAVFMSAWSRNPGGTSKGGFGVSNDGINWIMTELSSSTIQGFQFTALNGTPCFGYDASLRFLCETQAGLWSLT